CRFLDGLSLTQQHFRFTQFFDDFFCFVPFSSCHLTCLLFDLILTYFLDQFLGGRSNWAVQRAFVKKEMRYYRFIESKVSLLVDLYDVSRYPDNWFNRRNPFDINRCSPL